MRVLALLVVGLIVSVSQPSHAKTRRPAAVIAKISLGGPSALDPIRTVANTVTPGAGAMLSTPFIVSMTQVSTNGLDLDGPLHLLYVDTPAVQGFALVGRVTDATLLAKGTPAKNGWAVAGDKKVTRLVGGWALSTLAAPPASPELVITLYPGAFMSRYKKQIAEARAETATGGELPPELMNSYWDMLLGFGKDTEELTLRFEVTKDIAALDIAFVPKRRTRLATFASLQQPSDFGLIAKLVNGSPIMVGAGRIAMGPYRRGMMEMMESVYGPIASGKLSATVTPLLDAMTGEFAMLMYDRNKTLAVDGIYTVEPGAAVDALLPKMIAAMVGLQTFTIGKITTKVQAVAPTTHAGVTIHAYDSTVTGGPPNPMLPPTTRSSIAAFDNLLLLTTGSDAARSIDAARGKAKSFTPTKAQAQLFDRSRRRDDSFAMVMDIGGLTKLGGFGLIPTGTNLVFALGFADGAVHFNMAMPMSVLKSLTSVGKPTSNSPLVPSP